MAAQVIGWIIQVLKYVDIGWNGAKMNLVIFVFLIVLYLVDSIKGFRR